MAEPIGDDETFSRGMAQARAALGGRSRRRTATPVPVDLREVPPPADEGGDGGDQHDDRDARIAALEAEVRHLRATLARIHDETRRTLGP